MQIQSRARLASIVSPSDHPTQARRPRLRSCFMYDKSRIRASLSFLISEVLSNKMQRSKTGLEAPFVLCFVSERRYNVLAFSWYVVRSLCIVVSLNLKSLTFSSLEPVKGKVDLSLHHESFFRWRPHRTIRIYKNNPMTVHARDANGNIPLHRACKDRNYDLIEFLTETYPQGWGIPNYDNEYPLHILLRKQWTRYQCAAQGLVISRVLYKCIEYCETSVCRPLPTDCTEYPLHMFLRLWLYKEKDLGERSFVPGGWSSYVAEKWAMICPEATKTMSRVDGKLPIHLACEASFDYEAIQAMDTSTISIPSVERKLPLQYALTCKRPERNVIYYLCRQFPSATYTHER